jgi:hypothetical protein
MQCFGMIVLIGLLAGHKFANAFLDSWGLHGLLLSASVIFFSISMLIQIISSFVFFIDIFHKNIKNSKMHQLTINGDSISFHCFIFTIFFNQITVGLELFSLSFSSKEGASIKGDGFDTPFDEANMKIKDKCLEKNLDVLDIKSAPRTTPTQYKINEMKSVKSTKKKF